MQSTDYHHLYALIALTIKKTNLIQFDRYLINSSLNIKLFSFQLIFFCLFCILHVSLSKQRNLINSLSSNAQVKMLKWTKRAEPGGSGDAASKLSTLLLAAPQQSNHQRTHTRRSLGNLSRPSRLANREKQRKSLGSSELTKRIQNRDKENHLVLTPHPNGFRQNITSTPVIAFGSKLDYALRDVRNITPKQSSNTNSISALLNAMTPSRKRPLAKTPPASPKVDRVICSSPKETALVTSASVIIQQTPYASTLPTFDVEYSPCGPSQSILQPNPKNSITVTTDSFFNQPRYFQEPLPASKRLKFSPGGSTPMPPRLIESRFSRLKFSTKKSSGKTKAEKMEKDCLGNGETVVESGNNLNNNNNDNKMNQNECNDVAIMKAPAIPNETKMPKNQIPSTETSLSSSALDDTALDKMIDAILESARKERPSIVRNLAPRKMHMALMQMDSDSPTYTPAEDPANDLNKFCDNFQISPDKLIGERTIILEEPNSVNEREIRTPEPFETKRIKLDNANRTKLVNSCHLKRQRAVRRKHTKCDQQQQQSEQQRIKSEPSSTDINLSDGQNEVIRPECSDLLSPKTPTDSDFVMSSFFKKNADELANMNTPVIDSSDSNVTYAQQPHCGITSISSKMSSDSTPCINTNDLQASSTPTHIETVNAIRRCLTFSDSPSRSGSSANDDSLDKRKSTASSTNSMASMSNISNSVRANNIISGSLDLSIFSENNKIHIHGELV